MFGDYMPNNCLQVLIIGAGTGGLALAHGLKQAGIHASVFERDRIPHDVPGGYRCFFEQARYRHVGNVYVITTRVI
jgi:cation diffusion facilitator CzcD-associated flavoprotein CzcO